MSGGSATYNGDGVSGLYIWGAQMEALEFASSYIRTEGSTVSRVGDLTSIPQSGNIKDDSDLTIFAKVNISGNDPSNSQSIMGATTTTNDIYMRRFTGDEFRYRRGSVATNSPELFIIGVTTKVAITYDRSTNLLQSYFDGAPSGNIDAGGALVLDGDIITIGTESGGGGAWNGHILEMSIYDKTLTAQEVSLL